MTIEEKVQVFGLTPSNEYTGDEYTQEELISMDVAYVKDTEDNFFLFNKDGLDILSEDKIRELMGRVDE